jgi:phosphoribosylformylglycinamidine synthase
MKQVKAIVLRAAGINCDMETVYALELAGADAEAVHINRIIENKKLLDEYQIIVFPGGLRVRYWQIRLCIIFWGR